jgi:hypothetical protein
MKKMVGAAGFEQSLLRLAQLGHINILLIYTPKGRGYPVKFHRILVCPKL